MVDPADGWARRGWSVGAIRAAEAATGELLTNGTLMQRAAAGLADVIKREVERLGASAVIVLVGPGNNGGDALYAVRNLTDAGVASTAVLVSDRAHEGGLAAAEAAGVPIVPRDEGVALVRAADVVVDGVLGIGAEAREDAPWQDLLDAISDEAFVIAVDVPTPGVSADLTVTFGAPKSSLLTNPWSAGRIEVVDIGFDEYLGEAETLRLSEVGLAQTYPVPGPSDHKYTRGVVGLATGSNAYPGAAVLGAVAAVTAGAGMVRYLGPSRPSDAVLAATPEVVFGDGRVQAWVVGSGVDADAEREAGSDRYTQIMDILEQDVPVVVDAGALPWLELADRPERAVTIITPHAGELENLLTSRGIDVDRATIEADPVPLAKHAADETNAVVMLKGAATVIATPGNELVFVENRSPHWLATAGTGDILAALTGVFVAAGIAPTLAAALAAYLHGRAANLANPGGPVRALEVARSLGRAVANLAQETAR